MKYLLEFEEFNDYQLIESIADEIEILIDDYNAPELIENYLHENYGINYLDYDFINEDVNQQQEEENQQGTPKKTLGQKTKEHFKKHWKKYAAGTAVAGGATALGLYGKKKGWFDKKKEIPPPTKQETPRTTTLLLPASTETNNKSRKSGKPNRKPRNNASDEKERPIVKKLKNTKIKGKVYDMTLDKDGTWIVSPPKKRKKIPLKK